MVTMYLSNCVGQTGHELALIDELRVQQAGKEKEEKSSADIARSATLAAEKEDVTTSGEDNSVQQEVGNALQQDKVEKPDLEMEAAIQLVHSSTALDNSNSSSPETLASLAEEVASERRDESAEADTAAGGLLMEMARYNGPYGQALRRFRHLTTIGHLQDFTVPINSSTIRSTCPHVICPQPGMTVLGASGFSFNNEKDTNAHSFLRQIRERQRAMDDSIGTKHHEGEPFTECDNGQSESGSSADLTRCNLGGRVVKNFENFA
jgi:hypothetical protein